MRRFRVGVVGIGDISDVYLDNLARHPDIVDVVGCLTAGWEVANRTRIGSSALSSGPGGRRTIRGR